MGGWEVKRVMGWEGEYLCEPGDSLHRTEREAKEGWNKLGRTRQDAKGRVQPAGR